MVASLTRENRQLERSRCSTAACAARLLANIKLALLMKNHLSGRGGFRYGARGWMEAAPLGGDYILHEVFLCGNAIDAPIKETTTQAQEVQTAGGNRQDEVNVSTILSKSDGAGEGTHLLL